MAFNIFPRVAVLDEEDSSSGDVIFPGQRCLGRAASESCQDSSDLGLIQFGATVVLALGMPSLVDLIHKVFHVGSNPEMGRVDARRVVAMMADAEPGGKIAIGEFPCEYVSADITTIGKKKSVPVSITVPSPEPARSRWSEPNGSIPTGRESLLRWGKFEWCGRSKVSPPLVMLTAIASRDGAASALSNATRSTLWFSHSTSLGSVVRDRSGATTPAGPVQFSMAYGH